MTSLSLVVIDMQNEAASLCQVRSFSSQQILHLSAAVSLSRVNPVSPGSGRSQRAKEVCETTLELS